MSDVTLDPAGGQVPSHPRIDRLKTRKEFLAAAKGASLARGGVAIQMRPRKDADAGLRVGFTATKKIGGAVQRNRAKRRLREAARALLPLHGQAGCDYVFVARLGVDERLWLRLLDDVRAALIGLAAGGDEPRPARKPHSASSRPAPRRRPASLGPSPTDG